MATIRSFTSLEQSRKLAEILPLESADMIFVHTIDLEGDEHYDIDFSNKNPLFEDDVCAWSLAALLGVLPKNLKIGRPSLESNYKGYYWIKYYNEFMKPNNYKTKCFNNPVDACYEMILKLNELKML